MTDRPGGSDESPGPDRSAEIERIPLTAGLCARCLHARRIVSGRGSVFVLCEAAAIDPRLARYPRLPRWRCNGFESSRASDATLDLATPERSQPTADEIDEWSSWAAVTEGFQARASVPAVQALNGLLDAARHRWAGKVAVGWSMHELWFTPNGSRDPFPVRLVVTWSAGVYEFRLEAQEMGREPRVITVDRCFEPNAQVVLDAFLYQLTNETIV